MILFVDDERFVVEPFITALREKFGEARVEYRNEPGRALEHLKGELRDKSLELAILDVMMDNAPDDWDGAGPEGEASGLMLADKIRELYPKVPIVFFTSQRNQFQLSRIKGYPNATYVDKRETQVPKFVSIVEDRMEMESESSSD